MSWIQELRDALSRIPPGPINDNGTQQEIVRLLQNCWEQLTGAHDAAMSLFKLDRAEQLSWNLPSLDFVMERHGGTALGTRADLQQWSVNLESERADYLKIGHQQLTPMAKRVDVEPIVVRVLDAVRQGPEGTSDLTKSGVLIWHVSSRFQFITVS